MAEEDKTVVEGGTPEEAPQKKSGYKLILFGGIGVGAIVIGVVLALFVIKPMMSETPAGVEGDGTEQAEKKHEDKEKKPLVDEHGNEVSSLIYSMENIVINPAGTGGSRFLSVSFGFEIESMELQEEFTHREPVIRDALITILSSKTVAELTDAKQKEIVRYQIKKRLSKLMHTKDLTGVYYTDFVLQ